jgi:hypothetical protein
MTHKTKIVWGGLKLIEIKIRGPKS